MKSPVKKRSLVIRGHKTSVSLENQFWDSFKEIANERDMTLSGLANQIDEERKHTNLSSGIRLFVLEYYRAAFAALRAADAVASDTSDTSDTEYAGKLHA